MGIVAFITMGAVMLFLPLGIVKGLVQKFLLTEYSIMFSVLQINIRANFQNFPHSNTFHRKNRVQQAEGGRKKFPKNPSSLRKLPPIFYPSSESAAFPSAHPGEPCPKALFRKRL